MADSDDDLLDPGPILRPSKSRGNDKDGGGGSMPSLSKKPKATFSVKELLQEQAKEQKRIDAIIATAPASLSPGDDDDDMMVDGDDGLGVMAEEDGAKRAEDMLDPDLDGDNDDDIGRLFAKISSSLGPKGTGEDEDDEGVDLDKEDFAEWRGLTSVFFMAEIDRRFTDFHAFVKQPSEWGDAYRTLYDAIAGAGQSLPDILCAWGVARWLSAKRLPVPPHLMEWLIHLVALTDDAAAAMGAFRNLEALLSKDENCGEFSVPERCLEGWSLSFSSTLTTILKLYGVHLTEDGVDFVRSIDTTAADQKFVRTGIPPIRNLGYLLQTVQWTLKANRLKISGSETLLFLSSTLLLSLDRYIQAGCPSELRGLTAALLERIPEAQWPSPAILDITNAVLNRKDVVLSNDSAIQIARSIGLQSDRERDMVASLTSSILQTRILHTQLADALKAVCVLREPEGYLTTLLTALNGSHMDSFFEDAGAVVIYQTAYCVELLSKAVRGLSKAYMSQLYEEVSRFEKTRRGHPREEEAQTAKDILSLEAMALKSIGRSRGPVQTKLTAFADNNSH